MREKIEDNSKFCKYCGNSVIPISDEEKNQVECEPILGGEDSAEQFDLCKEKIAVLNLNSKKNRKFLKIFLPIFTITVLVLTLIVVVVIPNIKYNKALAYMNKGDYLQASAIFNDLEGHKDANEKYSECINMHIDAYKKTQFDNCKVNGEIYMGSLVQDISKKNEKEDVEWIVVEKDDDKALLLSKYIIYYEEFDQYSHPSDYDFFVWESSSLREKLNGDFFNSVFSTSEKSRIINSEITNGEMRKTSDKLFLLNSLEVTNFWPEPEDRFGRNTPLYKKKLDNKFPRSSWLLRDTGGKMVSYWDGSIEKPKYDTPARIRAIGIRPSMWIKIK